MPPLDLPKHVLVVDDEFDVARALARLLRSVARVDFEQSPNRALYRLRDGDRYDVILCDVNMPEMNGVDFYDRVAQEFPAASEVFVFASGAMADVAVAARLRATGRPCLEKPVRVEELLKVMAELPRAR
jgi:CheY-like chemotaxis protein